MTLNFQCACGGNIKGNIGQYFTSNITEVKPIFRRMNDISCKPVYSINAMCEKCGKKLENVVKNELREAVLFVEKWRAE